jgi:hypothetical protein
MRKIIILTIFTLMSSYIFGQQSKSDSLTLEFKKYEITEQDFPLLGKQKVIMGTVIIKKGNKKIATHDFLVPLKQDPISHIAVLDTKSQKIEPRIHYNISEKAFTYYEGTDKEGKVKVKDTLPQKDLVLFGLWVWARLIY